MSTLECDICVIGAGPAGLSLALELARSSNRHVTLIPGGDESQSLGDETLLHGSVSPTSSHEPLHLNRYRGLGGGSRVWGGRLVPFDGIDLENRGGYPLDGWPIEHSELQSWYPLASHLCQVPDFSFSYQPLADGEVPLSLGSGTIDAATIERWSPPTDFANTYLPTLRSYSRFRLLDGYHATKLFRCRNHSDMVDTLQVKSRSQPELLIRAKDYVLAAGTLETTRLLLASKDADGKSLGDEHDLLGRFYMSHLFGTCGRLVLDESAFDSFYKFHRDEDRLYYRRRFRLSDASQRSQDVLNIVGFPLRPRADSPDHHDPILSLLHLYDSSKRIHETSWSEVPRLQKHIRNVLRGGPLAWFDMRRQLRMRRESPRLPMAIPFSRESRQAFFFQSEHSPNRESRVRLGTEVDEFEMPRLDVQIRFSKKDFDTVRTFYSSLSEALINDGIGQLSYRESNLEEVLLRIPYGFDSGSHQLGTTRMSRRPDQGLVDENLRMHTVRNLHICSGAVFPTSGHANPTLTIIALALRLANHLA